MMKTYVLDTNVLIHAPYAMECFEDNNVIIPMVVIEELDGLKKAEGDKGASAREAIRSIEKYRNQGDLFGGIPLKKGGVLKIDANCIHVELPESLPADKPDNRILKVCKFHKDQGEQIVLVTKDLVLRIKADVLGVVAEDFTTEQVPKTVEQYTGRAECFLPEEIFKEFRKKGVRKDQVYMTDENEAAYAPELFENQFVILRADQSLKKTQLGRVEGEFIVPLEYKKSKPYGITPRNVGQYFLQEALMQPADKAPLVIVKGMAGLSFRKFIHRSPNSQYLL